MTQPLSKRILLAEDDGSMRSFLDLMLQRAGYDVIACEDGAVALKFLEEFGEAQHCDLLLTDVVMPNMDGIELTQKALALYPHLKVLYITGFAAVESTPSVSKSDENLSQIIPKPFHINELLEKIAKTLEIAS